MEIPTTSISSTNARFRASRFSPLALGCAVVLGIAGLMAPVKLVQASGIPTIDIAAITESITQFIQENSQWATTLEQYGKTVTQYGKEVQHFKDTLSKYQSILNNINAAAMTLQGIGGNLKPVDEQTYMVSERCRTNTSLSDFAGSLIGMLPSLKLDGDKLDMNEIRRQQINVCVVMQRTRNKRYNASLKFITDSLPEMQASMKMLQDQRNASSTPGALADTNADAAMLGSQLEQQMRDYQANMAAYDTYLASLQDTQVTLAEIALKGSGTSLLGTTVRTTALMSALNVSPSDIVP